LGDALGPSTQIDAIRADNIFENFKGDGQTIVVIDDGGQASHEQFSGRVVYQYDFVENDNNAYNPNGSHGTHVAGTAAGKDWGIAPEANIILLRVIGPGGDLEKALKWVVQNCDVYNVASVNLSLGLIVPGTDRGYNDTSADTTWMSDEFASLRSNGVFVCAAAGNDYAYYAPQQGVGYPASDPNVFSVGSVWTNDRGGPFNFLNGATDYSTSTDALAAMSQRSTVLTDVFAPGGEVYSGINGNSYEWFSGTSMASPQVAGFAAIAQEAALEYLGRKLSVDELSGIITDNADTIYDGDDENDNVINTNSYYKRINFEKSLKAIEDMSSNYGLVATVGTDDISQLDLGFVPISGFNGTVSNDTVVGTSSADIMRLLDGDDEVSAGAGNDDIYLGDGDDTVNAGSGNDIIYAGDGDDIVNGSSGDDIIYAGAGSDTLTGGEGADTFIFYNVEGENIITDFNQTEDKLQFYSDKASVLQMSNLVESLSLEGNRVLSTQDNLTSVTFASAEKTGSITITTAVDDNFGDEIVLDQSLVFVGGETEGTIVTMTSGVLASFSDDLNFTHVEINSSSYDHGISISDVVLQLRDIVGLSTLDGKQKIAADINGDGEMSISDVVSNLRHIVGLDTIDECVLLDSSDELVTSLKNSTIADLTLVQLGDADLSATFLIA
jgi:Ca2+-binding RTX toxin-like protein